MALYIIISVEEFGKVQNCEKTFLVKANQVKEIVVNNNPIGYDFTKMESSETEWFIFEKTELNLKKILFWVKQCEDNRFWAADAFGFLQASIEYFDTNDNKVKIKKVFLDGSNNTIECIKFYPESYGETIDLQVPPIPFPPSGGSEDSERMADNNSIIDLSKPVV